MGRLAERVKTVKKSGKCKVCDLLLGDDKELAEDLAALLADPSVYPSQIRYGLMEEGHPIAESTIRRHLGGCNGPAR